MRPPRPCAVACACLPLALLVPALAFASFNTPLCPPARTWDGAFCSTNLAWILAFAFGLPLIPWLAGLGAVLHAARPWRRPEHRGPAWAMALIASIVPLAAMYLATPPSMWLAARLTDDRSPAAVIVWFGGPGLAWIGGVLAARRLAFRR